jgi:hypothetical protein
MQRWKRGVCLERGRGGGEMELMVVSPPGREERREGMFGKGRKG